MFLIESVLVFSGQFFSVLFEFKSKRTIFPELLKVRSYIIFSFPEKLNAKFYTKQLFTKNLTTDHS